MKRFLVLAALVVMFMPARVSAQESPAGSLSAGVSLGLMDGMGVELAYGLTDNLNVRAGYSMFPSFLIKEYEISLPAWAGNPATNTAFTGKGAGTGNLLLDFHPYAGGSFRITAGVFFGAKDFLSVYNTKALPESYHAAGVTYHVDGDRSDVTKFYRVQSNDKGIISAAIEESAVRPFIGIGFGSAVPKKTVGVSFDLGVEYTGSLALRSDARNIKGDVETITLTQAGLIQTVYDIRNKYDDQGNPVKRDYDKYLDYVDKLRALPVLPVARLSIFVKLF